MGNKDFLNRRGFLESAALAGGMTCLGLGSALYLANSKTEAAGVPRKRVERFNCDLTLDPGHGLNNKGNGLYDSGCGYGGIEEASYCLDFAKQLRDKLERHGINVRMTRENRNDNTLLSSRARVANRDPESDIFVSIHCNAFTDERARGARTYHFPGSSGGRRLARNVQDSLLREIGKRGYTQNYDGVRSQNFLVLRETDMPAVLVELGFLSNSGDREFMRTHKPDYVEGVYQGILDYSRQNPRRRR